MEKLTSNHSKSDILFFGKGIPLDLEKIARMPNGQAQVETIHTHKKLLVAAQSRWVKIEPDLPFTGLPPEIFIKASMGSTNFIELAVYTKKSNGQYFDEDFRALPLARSAVEFLISHNPGVQGIAFEYIEGSDTYAVYERVKKRLRSSGMSEQQARRQAPKEVWDYINIAARLHFTDIRHDVCEEIDSDSGCIHVNGVFYRK